MARGPTSTNDVNAPPPAVRPAAGPRPMVKANAVRTDSTLRVLMFILLYGTERGQDLERSRRRKARPGAPEGKRRRGRPGRPHEQSGVAQTRTNPLSRKRWFDVYLDSAPRRKHAPARTGRAARAGSRGSAAHRRSPDGDGIFR